MFQTSYPTKKTAVEAARQMRKLLMKPKGWMIRVHCSEPNPKHQKHGVWYPGLINGPLSLSYIPGSGFMTLLGRRMSDRNCGNPEWTTRFVHENPNKAVAHQIRAFTAVNRDTKELEKHLSSLL